MSPIEYAKATEAKTSDAATDLIVAMKALPSEYRLRVMQRAAAYSVQERGLRRLWFVLGCMVGGAFVALLWWLK